MNIYTHTNIHLCGVYVCVCVCYYELSPFREMSKSVWHTLKALRKLTGIKHHICLPKGIGNSLGEEGGKKKEKEREKEDIKFNSCCFMTKRKAV